MTNSWLKLLGKKDGISHVEIVFSFVLFVGAVFFIYFLLEPSIVTKNKPVSMEYLIEKIKNVSSANLTSVSVNVNSSSTGNCAQFQDFFSKVPASENFSVMGNITYLNAKKPATGNDLFVELNSNNFFKVYISSELTNQTGAMASCTLLIEGVNYSLGLVKTEKKIFVSKILNVIQEYEENYSNVKLELNVPHNVNFGFSFVYANGTSISTKEKIPNVDIYSEKSAIQYIDKNSHVEAGELIIRAW